MPLRVQCSAGHLMMVPDHRAGTVLRCPNCGIDVQVPAAPGSMAKDAARPRISTPVLAGKDAKPGLAAPNLSKPKTKLPAVAEAKPKGPPKPVVEEIVALEAVPQEPVAREVENVVEPSLPETPEIVFTTPVVSTPTPLAAAPLIVDQSTIETVELPPKKPVRELAPAPAYARQRDGERHGLDSRKPIEPPFEIKDEPDAPHVIEAEVMPDAPVAPMPLPPLPEPVLHSAATVVDPHYLPAHEPAAPPRILVQGVQPTSSQRHTAWQLAAALFAALLLSIGPSLWEIIDYLRSDGEVTVAVARWAFLLLLLGVIQLGSIMLLVQVPDWSSVWIVTLQSLALASMYAGVLGLTIITGANSSLIAALNLDQQYNSGKAPPWCICLAATYACLAFFAGRFSAKWRKIHRQVESAERAAAHA
jgi:hypothetical protein